MPTVVLHQAGLYLTTEPAYTNVELRARTAIQESYQTDNEAVNPFAECKETKRYTLCNQIKSTPAYNQRRYETFNCNGFSS